MSNHLSGAFGYAIAITSARNFTVQNNNLFGNTTFIGSRGPNCTNYDNTPTPQPFVLDRNNTDGLSVQSEFVGISDGDSLTCILPPPDGDYWPYREDTPSGNNTSPGGGSTPGGSGGGDGSGSGGNSSGLSSGSKAGIAVGVILGVALIAIATYLIRKAALKKQQQDSGTTRLVSEDEDMWEGKQATHPSS